MAMELDAVGATTTLAVSEAVTLVPAAFVAVAVQVTVPAEAPAVTVKPLEPEPEPAPEQEPELEVAPPPATHPNVAVVPTVMLALLMATELRVGAATMLRLAEPVAVEPAAFVAVTVQVPVPAALVVTVMLPLVPEPEPVAPEQATVALVAPLVDQVKVLLEPTVTVAGLNERLPTDGAATTLAVSDAVTL